MMQMKLRVMSKQMWLYLITVILNTKGKVHDSSCQEQQ